MPRSARNCPKQRYLIVVIACRSAQQTRTQRITKASYGFGSVSTCSLGTKLGSSDGRQALERPTRAAGGGYLLLPLREVLPAGEGEAAAPVRTRQNAREERQRADKLLCEMDCNSFLMWTRPRSGIGCSSR
eukprot:scaffold1272_cov250-Pinguiococcus_pyrenoidosus.AAC.25